MCMAWRVLCKTNALTLLVGQQEGNPACENWVVRYRRGYLPGEGRSLPVHDNFCTYIFGTFFDTASFGTLNVNIGTVTFSTYKISVQSTSAHKCQFQYKHLRYKSTLVLPHHHTTTVLRPFFRDHLGEPVPEETFWTLWCKGRLTEADTPTIRLGATPSGLTSAHLSSMIQGT